MDTETLLRRNVAELRALLDLSYSRERLLAESTAGLLYLLEGAAVAPDRQERMPALVDGARGALDQLRQQPVPNHGLFADYARLGAEHKAVLHVNATLNTTLNNTLQTVANLNCQLNDARARLLEAEAVRTALTELMAKPELVEPVARAAQDLARARAQNAQATLPPRRG